MRNGCYSQNDRSKPIFKAMPAYHSSFSRGPIQPRESWSAAGYNDDFVFVKCGKRKTHKGGKRLRFPCANTNCILGPVCFAIEGDTKLCEARKAARSSYRSGREGSLGIPLYYSDLSLVAWSYASTTFGTTLIFRGTVSYREIPSRRYMEILVFFSGIRHHRPPRLNWRH